MYAERFKEARALLDAAMSEARAAANGLLLPVLFAHRGWLCLRRGDLAAADAGSRASLEAPEPRASLLHRLLASGVLVEALADRGELDAAQRPIGPFVDQLQGPSLKAGILRHASEAVAVLDTPVTRLEQARTLTDLGALLRRQKRRAEARELLRCALDVAHRAGAAPLADRAGHWLASCAQRRRVPVPHASR